MFLLLILTCVIWTLQNVQGLIAASESQYIPAAGSDSDPKFERITNGNVATRGELPWQVFITADAKVACGGSLISPEWVLTAAHCIAPYTQFELFLGGADLEKFEDGRIRMLSTKKIVHPDYKALKLRNDVALIKLPIPVTIITDFISPIRLGARSDYYNTFVGEMVMAGGWGKTSDGAKTGSKILNKVYLPVIPNEICSKRFQGGVPITNICCSGAANKSVCSGDSGGALTIESDDGVATQIGITSFVSNTGCTVGEPSVYVRVYRYLFWINHHTGIKIRP